MKGNKGSGKHELRLAVEVYFTIETIAKMTSNFKKCFLLLSRFMSSSHEGSGWRRRRAWRRPDGAKLGSQQEESIKVSLSLIGAGRRAWSCGMWRKLRAAQELLPSRRSFPSSSHFSALLLSSTELAKTALWHNCAARAAQLSQQALTAAPCGNLIYRFSVSLVDPLYPGDNCPRALSTGAMSQQLLATLAGAAD